VQQRAYHAKQELGQELVRNAAAQALPFATVLFDGWYLLLSLTEAIEQCHKDWIGSLPKDRPVDWQGRWINSSIICKGSRPNRTGGTDSRHPLLGFFIKVLEVKSLNRRVRIIASYDNGALCGEPELLVTNRKEREPTKILTSFLYRCRPKVQRRCQAATGTGRLSTP
jgi:hypothetical protein